MASDVTISSALAGAQATQSQATQLSEDFDDFLNLLTTQLQNQDPLNPTDSTEFTNQIVQFSQVEQQINFNQKLDDLLQLQLASISSVALGYVGLDASYVSADMNFDGETPIKIRYALNEDAQTVKINIYDEDNALVYSGDAPAVVGANEIDWDGITSEGFTAEAGTYSVSIDAVSAAGEPIENIQTVVTGRVRGIETQNGVVYTLIGDRAVALSSIINASLPDSTPSSTEEPTDGGTDGA